MRDGLFVCITPILKKSVEPHFSKEYSAALLAGIMSGIIATLSTQAFDTIKTAQQKNDGDANTLIKTAKLLYSQNGVKALFSEGLARGMRVTSAVTILGYVSSTLEEMAIQRNEDIKVVNIIH